MDGLDRSAIIIAIRRSSEARSKNTFHDAASSKSDVPLTFALTGMHMQSVRDSLEHVFHPSQLSNCPHEKNVDVKVSACMQLASFYRPFLEGRSVLLIPRCDGFRMGTALLANHVRSDTSRNSVSQT